MRKAGLAMILAGVLLVAASLGITFYNVADSNRAQEASQRLLAPIAARINGRKLEMLARQEETLPVVRPEALSVPEMDVVEQDGDPYIGIIEIPELSLTLPVLHSWSYELLKLAPCRYSGSYYTNDLVICAHNYPAHFNDIRTVSIGADVYFTSANGTQYHYVIANRETLQPEENDRLITADESWDLTLFTCYIGGQTRCVLRCTLVDEGYY